MAQIRGTAGYHLGNQSPFGNAGHSNDTNNDPSPLDQLRAQTSKLEELLDTVADPIKP
jgi:ER-derived vesicles protein